jgi:opacity protein-like surface antigen
VKSICLAAAALAGLPAFAQENPAPAPQPDSADAAQSNEQGFYLSAGLGGLRIDEDPFVLNPGWGSFQIRGGYSFNQYIAIEGETLVSFNPYTFDDEGENYDDSDAADLKSAFAVYAVPRIPVSSTIDLYGRVGYLWTEYDYGSGPLSGLTTTSSGPGFGGGVDVEFGSKWSVYLDYTWFDLSNEDEFGGVTDSYDASGSLLSVGFTFRL